MIVNLSIPYGNKDEAKKIAKENACALFFEPVTKKWELRGKLIPQELKKYIIAGTERPEEGDVVVQASKAVTAPAKKPAANKAAAKSVATKTPAILEEKPVSKRKPKTDDKYTHVVDMPFEMRNLVGALGGKYNGDYKTNTIKGEELPDLLVPYRSQPYSYEAWVEQSLNNGKIREEIKSMYALKDIFTPRDYQKEAKKVMVQAYKDKLGGFLLADEVGLGKTISAGIFAQEKQFKNILVITTLSAVAHWRKTFLKLALPDKNIIIMNYDRLQKLFKTDENKYKTKAKTKKTKNKRVANNGIAPAFDLVIFDEAHKLRNNTSMRSKLAFKIVEKAGFTLYLSATAGQNPLELSYLSPLLAKLTGQSVKSMEDFEMWCKGMNLGIKRGEFGKWIWDQSPESIDKIHSLLFKGKPLGALRRIPSDIAGYPEISRELMPFELDPEEYHSYNMAWQEFKAVMHNEKVKGKKNSKEIGLVARLRLRQKASFLKIPYTLESIESFLENGHQVAVSVAFKETLFELEAKLKKLGITCSTIHGEHNAAEKEKQRVDFQKGINKVVLFTVEEAISLHQGEMNDVPRTMLIHDLRWSAISMSQIEGRTHRDGKFSQIYWLYFADTIEEDIAKIVLNRVISMKSMVGDDTTVLKEIEALLNSKIE